MPQSLQPPAAPNGGIYPKFIQSQRALAGQQYGRSGLQYFMPGWIKRDFLPQLQGQALFKTYTEMGDNDAYVGAALSAFAVFIRRAHWKVDVVDDANKDNGSAEFLQECMADMTHSWQNCKAHPDEKGIETSFRIAAFPRKSTLQSSSRRKGN